MLCQENYVLELNCMIKDAWLKLTKENHTIIKYKIQWLRSAIATNNNIILHSLVWKSTGLLIKWMQRRYKLKQSVLSQTFHIIKKQILIKTKRLIYSINIHSTVLQYKIGMIWNWPHWYISLLFQEIKLLLCMTVRIISSINKRVHNINLVGSQNIWGCFNSKNARVFM